MDTPELPPAGEWQQALHDIATKAEARGREQGRRELVEGVEATAREEWRVVYRDGRDSDVVWMGNLPDRATAEKALATCRGEGWPNAAMRMRTHLTWPDGSVLTRPWVAADFLESTGGPE